MCTNTLTLALRCGTLLPCKCAYLAGGCCDPGRTILNCVATTRCDKIISAFTKPGFFYSSSPAQLLVVIPRFITCSDYWMLQYNNVLCARAADP